MTYYQAAFECGPQSSPPEPPCADYFPFSDLTGCPRIASKNPKQVQYENWSEQTKERRKNK